MHLLSGQPIPLLFHGRTANLGWLLIDEIITTGETLYCPAQTHEGLTLAFYSPWPTPRLDNSGCDVIRQGCKEFRGLYKSIASHQPRH